LPVEEDIKRLEQVWLVLSDFSQDLNRRNIAVAVAPDLRDCKTLIHFIRTSVAHPSKELATIDNFLRNLMQILDKIRSSLITEALKLGENYVNEWLKKIDKAERAELSGEMIYTQSEFASSLPRDPEKGWVRLTLQNPIAEERVQDIAEQFGVIIEFQNSFHILISGQKESVRKATIGVYELSLE